jgi:hypothetical protein
MLKFVRAKNDKTKTYLTVFHTQKSRGKILSEPCKCRRKDAWLGEGYYFWLEEEFAHYWGKDSKINSRTQYYCIYKAYIDIDTIYRVGTNYNSVNTRDNNPDKERILDATFSEKGYFLFRDYVEEAITHIRKNSGLSLSLKQVHRYLADEVWPNLNIKGIIYDDLPKNSPSREYSGIPPLFYKKRIQLVIFDLSLVKSFALHLDMQN